VYDDASTDNTLEIYKTQPGMSRRDTI